MKKLHNGCDQTLIDLYFDNELGQDEHARFSEHISHCPSCQKALRDNQAISTLFKSGLDKEVSQANLDALEERVLDLIRKKRSPWWRKVIDLFVSKKLLIPAAAMAVMLIFFSIIRQPAPVSVPSAIVKSFSGDVSSVMIIETPKSRNVIIWYNESS